MSWMHQFIICRRLFLIVVLLSLIQALRSAEKLFFIGIRHVSTPSSEQAASDRQHFHWAMDAVALIQHYFHDHKIVYYDLEHNTTDSFKVKMTLLCNVVYRKFNYSRYPEHVKWLKTYAWKPLVIHEMLLEFTGLFYIDSSVRLLDGLDALLTAVHASRGLVTFVEDPTSIFSATHAAMYDYLPISRSSAIDVNMRAAGLLYVHRTKQIYDNVIKWWVLCAVERSCIAPISELYCQFSADRDHFANCHRFDQSALNILLANYFNSSGHLYTAPPTRPALLRVARASKNKVRVYVCTRRNGTVPKEGVAIRRTYSKVYFNDVV